MDGKAAFVPGINMSFPFDHSQSITRPSIPHPYRAIFPAKEWALIRSFYRTGAKYFDYQRVMLDGFDEIPPASKAFICYHPHGILTIGWALSRWVGDK